jgi:AraC family transcriptional regulator
MMGVREGTQESYRERVLRAVVAIEANLDSRPSLRALARDACMSPFHFHRVFSAIVGEPVADYARRLRLERAARDLAGGARSIRTLARQAGYSRQESFTRAFVRRFAMSPREFRRAGASAAPGVRSAASWSGPAARIEVVQRRRVAFIRHVGPYEDVPPVFERIVQWARSRASTWREEPLFIGVAHDDPGITPAGRLRFDCCVTVHDGLRPEGAIAVQTVLGGRYAVALHRGPLPRIHETYAWLAREFIPRSRVEMRKAPAAELYLSSPERTPPDEQLTEVLLPIV